MLKLKNKNGITLIALIITIIVMLILVGVTLNIVLDENGIIAEAKKAKNQMESASEAETLQSAALGAIGTDGKIDFEKLDQNLPTGFEGSNGTYTSSKGTFTVDKNGNVTFGTESESILGAYVTYSGLNWRVISASDSSVELLSANAMGNVTIGISEGRDDDFVDAYNQMESFIIQECVEESGIINGIRSVGIQDRWIIESLGLLDAGEEYWVNYKEIKTVENFEGPYGTTTWGYYRVYFVNTENSISFETLFGRDMVYGGCYTMMEYTKAVRPVVSVNAGLFGNATGDGSEGNPFILN